MKIRIITILLITAITAITACAQKFDHSLFDEILHEYNHNGLVDYKNLKNDSRLNEYLESVANANPENLNTAEEEIAFWINIYNSYTIKAIVDNYPIESINDLHTGGRILGHILSTTVWDDDFVIVNGKEYSLNDVEHKILRKKFKEPRIHFAIVCASISCPKLRSEVFVASKLNDQLNSQAIQFFNDKTRNTFDVTNKVAHLSKILDWFSEDFGDTDEKVLEFVSNYLDEDIKKEIKKNVKDWTIEYLDYDWGLNDYKK